MFFLKITFPFLLLFLVTSCSDTKVTEVEIYSSSFDDPSIWISSSLEYSSSSLVVPPIFENSSSSLGLPPIESSSTLEMSSSYLGSSSSSVKEPPEVQNSSSSFGESPPNDSLIGPSINFSSSFERLSSYENYEPSSSSKIEISSSSLLVYKSGDYILGADISKFQEYESQGVSFYDTDNQKKSIFDILKNHGLNYIRLKTFVDPASTYGYAASGCNGTSTEAFGDKAHILSYAKKVKESGMGFLLDIHYSDTWADPKKQIIPERWRSITSIDVLSDSVYAYTYDLLYSLKSIGALPNMVQVGNEITDGLLHSVPTASTNCWGEPSEEAASSVSGKLSNYPANFAKLVNAGLKAVHDVDASIQTVLHIESAVAHGSWWLGVVIDQQKIDFDILAFSAYTAYGHGSASDWSSFINTQSQKYPNLKFLIAEYNGGVSASTWTTGKTKEINLTIKNTSNTIGSFYWEPALYGEWGGAAFEWNGNSLYAIPSAFSEFDEILPNLNLERH